MKKYIKANDEVYTNDPFLACEHAIVIAQEEAEKACRYLQNDELSLAMMEEIDQTLFALQKRIHQRRVVINKSLKR